jgi:5-formyltetrahydrofolate cyclo-ligase
MKTKDAIRQEIWQLLVQKKVARFPGAEGRIPNFIGAETCAKVLAETAIWKSAVLKANPTPATRHANDMAEKLYMAVRALSSDVFIELDPKNSSVRLTSLLRSKAPAGTASR